MTLQYLQISSNTIAYDDLGGSDPLVLLVPGAGDTMGGYRALVPLLAATGNRVVTMDLRGHGASSARWEQYDVAGSAADIVALLDHLNAGPATIIGTSFSPAAAVWAASERPELVERLVLISAHLEAAPAWQGVIMRAAMRGPLAASLWSSMYRKWHPGAPPADLDTHLVGLKAMMQDPKRRKAVRETLTAHRDGVSERVARLDRPTLIIMGEADSHFPNPREEGQGIADATGGELVVIPEAGHYPYAEYPDLVGQAINAFAARATT